MLTEILTDDQAALIWGGGDTSSLANLDTDKTQNSEQTNTDPTKTDDTAVVDDKGTPPAKTTIKDEDLQGIFGDPDEDVDDDVDDVDDKGSDKDTEDKTDTIQTTTRKGRKPAEFVALINQMIEDGSLVGFEDDAEVKTVEEARSLIKANLEEKEAAASESFWESKVKSYSPQVQAIIQYAESGGQDVSSLLSLISQAEKSFDFDIESEKGQEDIVRETLRMKGFDNEEIEDQISTLKDLEKLEAKAKKFLPELQTISQQKVQIMLDREEQRKRDAREAANIYLKTVESTLGKDTLDGVKIQREDKAKIFDALAHHNHVSLNGGPTNGFVKTLEELQFGKNQDYEHFLNIVHYAVDKKSFIEKIKASLKNEINAETVKKLKSAKSTAANTEQNFEGRQTRKTISRSEFKNPFQ